MKAIELRDEILEMLNEQLAVMVKTNGLIHPVPFTEDASGMTQVLRVSDVQLLMRDRANALAVVLADRCVETADTTEELAAALERTAKYLRERDGL